MYSDDKMSLTPVVSPKGDIKGNSNALINTPEYEPASKNDSICLESNNFNAMLSSSFKYLP